MAIRYDDSALATQTHPIARRHPETGRVALFVSPGYTIGIDGVPDDEGAALLNELLRPSGQAAIRLPPPVDTRHAFVLWTTAAWCTRPPAAIRAIAGC